ncbi:PP2C family protein-serine/threonine phosphatase [Streptomyces sp. NPDC060011]|uniref:PP2C family protein-serine/threonine phosphatase n=1 Tax=unclassified Streptomyces TaxID=2593676 RepID=UPI0013B73F22|nr:MULTISPECIES: PP2C family protein-serine/threonine phosphatase [unclassified Streptomyces]NEB28905.1 serine/threonine-protein phosphatase [Streptomyces sp. SID14446]MCX5136966.1 serine/threonine-protein phosphatase [Streptomyces sp. NBC_00340]MCX5285086.1 serine/threonine-protein phosphatase [Streptomyces sp. NBC_00198]WSD82617.1 serine/threonine-protein phosphatase [Streptomyces sp. NBC_01558]WSK65237.1 serine/threonine-protein phosphatase [Streptomyces sp. NBC_01281]
MNRFVAAERALRTAAPHQLLDAVRAVLCDRYTAESVELFMADYGLTVLQPVSVLPHTLEPIPVHSSPEGRAFGAQEPFVEERTGRRVRAHLPVTVRGDRLGVLSVTLPSEACDEETLAELSEVAEVLAHEVLVAERDTDLYLQARRKDRLTLAAEMQWQLLPGRSCARPEYELGAQLEPAYAIFGDNFDWSASADRLLLYITNGMGEGIEASLLTNLGINALRNARRAGISLQDQAALADQAIYAQYRGTSHLSVLMLDFELSTGRLRVIDAGSPQMLRLRGRSVERIGFEAQLPLGMFEETDYFVQEFQVEPGDRLLFVSDGVHAVAGPGGEAYGEKALAMAITSTQLLPATEVPRAVLRELTGHRGRPKPEDDALVVCLDWHGPQAAE